MLTSDHIEPERRSRALQVSAGRVALNVEWLAEIDTNKAGESTAVFYELHKRWSDRPGSLRDIYKGTVRPVFGRLGEVLTLVTRHGLTLQFSFEHRSDSSLIHSVETR